jgi:hypothetical protein
VAAFYAGASLLSWVTAAGVPAAPAEHRPHQLALAQELGGLSACCRNLAVEVGPQQTQQLNQPFAISGP